MIIMYPNQGSSFSDIGDRVGKELVHPSISLPRTIIKHYSRLIV